MIQIYYEDNSTQIISPSEQHFEYSSLAVKELVQTVAQGRPVKYYIDGVKRLKKR